MDDYLACNGAFSKLVDHMKQCARRLNGLNMSGYIVYQTGVIQPIIFRPGLDMPYVVTLIVASRCANKYPFTDTKPKIDPKACADGSFLTGTKVLKHRFVLKRVSGRGYIW